MANTKFFSTVLCRIRREKGFTSAHQLFKSVGGSKGLGMAFMSYWDIERGKKLPKSWRLKSLMDAVGVTPGSPEAKELVRAYFISLTGSDELLNILQPQGQEPQGAPARDIAGDAAKRMLNQLSVNMTMEQWQVRVQSIANELCQTYLNNTSGWSTVAQIAAATKFKTEEVRKALKALAAAGMTELEKDRARSRHEGKIIQLLPITPATFGVRKAMRDNWDKWLADSKRVIMRRCTVRMRKADLPVYRQHLDKFVELAEVYADAAANDQDSGIVMVEASIFKLLPR